MHRNKRAVSLNLNDPKGLEVFDRLVAKEASELYPFKFEFRLLAMSRMLKARRRALADCPIALRTIMIGLLVHNMPNLSSTSSTFA